MANTTNFNWETPDDTDLVKDGAAAIRTLGNSIDTSLVDLKGGTTGQILTKNSNTDLDFVWSSETGDISAVVAGTGISGGGTSGSVTITNSMATEITASGDIIVGTGSGTFDNLPIGTTGQVLTADTTVSPYKVKWAAVSASSGPTFRAYRSSSNQGLGASTWTKCQYQSEDWDTASAYDNTTNYRFTPATAGYYQVNACADMETNGGMQLALYKNGTINSSFGYQATGNNVQNNGGCLVYLNGSTDYIELYGLALGTTRNLQPSQSNSFFTAVWIRS
jgi:hypothetical protein